MHLHRQIGRSLTLSGVLLATLIGLVSWTASPTQRTAISQAEVPAIRFAVIGDFGKAGPDEESVANLVKSWQPDFIVTVGDNNYEKGEASTIDPNIGQYYYEYIYPYSGTYGSGSPGENRFFPALGNHDWGGGNNPAITCIETICTGPYFDYFTLPGNERYYDFIKGPVHFFVLDSDPREPDGIKVTSLQAAWLQQVITGSTAPWQLVVLHHPPYSSANTHGSTPNLQWPYQAWGADAVLAGHDHNYERLIVDGLVYFVNGAGGYGIRLGMTLITGSQSIYTQTFGAMLVEASAVSLTFQYIDVNNTLVDSYTITQTNPITLTATPTMTPTAILTDTPTPTSTLTVTATPTFTSTLTDTPTYTPTPTDTSTNTATPTPTSTPTNTPTVATPVSANDRHHQFLPFIRQ